MTVIYTVLELVVVLAVVATIHEFGHFIFAKMFKMKVDEFSIGFGKAILQKKYKGTKYSWRCVPLGGYCALDGEETESEDENSFAKKSPWKRIIVLLAGATFNALLATIIFLSINMCYDTGTTKIVELVDNSILLDAGIKEGDTITKIGNKSVHIIQDIMLFNDTSKGDIAIEYLRDGKEYKATLVNAVKTKGYMGVYFDTSKQEGQNTLACIELAEAGKPASKAGIKNGDKIIKINGKDVKYSTEVIEITAQNAGKEIEVTVLRDNEEKTLKVTPIKQKYIDFGIANVEVVDTNLKYSYYKSKSTITQIVSSYVDLFKGKVKVEQMSGIVGIGEALSRTDGFKEFINMLGIISLAIGVANILPFPPLDGGKIVLVIIEMITRKKVSYKAEAILSYIGFGLLIALTIYVTINDIIRIV